MTGRVPDRAKAPCARAGLRKLAAGVGIAAVALLPTSTSPTAAAVPAPGTTAFVDHGGPILRTAQVYLLYWGSRWPATGTYFPTPAQITAAFQTLLDGPYLSGLAQYRDIQPAVLRGSTVVTTSDPRSGFNDDDVSNFLSAQLDAGVVPGPGPDDQTLYIVVLPVGISAGGYRYEFDGEHYYYKRHGQRIHVVWAADSGSLVGATWIMSHEVVESITDPEGSAIRGVSSSCDQGGWCEIADVCFDTSRVNGVAVSRYWSEQARTCIAPDRARTQPRHKPCVVDLRRRVPHFLSCSPTNSHDSPAISPSQRVSPGLRPYSTRRRSAAWPPRPTSNNLGRANLDLGWRSKDSRRR